MKIFFLLCCFSLTAQAKISPYVYNHIERITSNFLTLISRQGSQQEKLIKRYKEMEALEEKIQRLPLGCYIKEPCYTEILAFKKQVSTYAQLDQFYAHSFPSLQNLKDIIKKDSLLFELKKQQALWQSDFGKLLNNFDEGHFLSIWHDFIRPLMAIYKNKTEREKLLLDSLSRFQLIWKNFYARYRLNPELKAKDYYSRINQIDTNWHWMLRTIYVATSTAQPPVLEVETEDTPATEDIPSSEAPQPKETPSQPPEPAPKPEPSKGLEA